MDSVNSSSLNPTTPIEIISERECRVAINALQAEVRRAFPDSKRVSVIPIMRGGMEIGEAVAQALEVDVNPMRVSYYNETNTRLPQPWCSEPQDMAKIFSNGEVTDVIFAEAVVDTGATISAAMEHITLRLKELNSGGKVPRFSVFALVSKLQEGSAIPWNMRALFQVDPDIWINGWGCDNSGQGRDEKRIMGVLSPHPSRIPTLPYYLRLF